MMRKTKLQLIDMLEEQRQIIVNIRKEQENEAHIIQSKQTTINTLIYPAPHDEAKYGHI